MPVIVAEFFVYANGKVYRSDARINLFFHFQPESLSWRKSHFIPGPYVLLDKTFIRR